MGFRIKNNMIKRRAVVPTARSWVRESARESWKDGNWVATRYGPCSTYSESSIPRVAMGTKQLSRS